MASLFLLVAGTIATLCVLGQKLPLQNIVGLAVTIAIFSGAILLGTSWLKLSFNPPQLNQNFSKLPEWTFPLIWLVALVNARGIAKLLLHRWRKNKNFGLWLLALSSWFVAGLNARNFFFQFAFGMIAFVVTTPWFLDKKRAESSADFQPLLLAILLLIW